MTLQIITVAADLVNLTASSIASKKAAGQRMFVPVAILTEAELDSLISRAGTSPGGLAHDLEDLRREFFE